MLLLPSEQCSTHTYMGSPKEGQWSCAQTSTHTRHFHSIFCRNYHSTVGGRLTTTNNTTQTNNYLQYYTDLTMDSFLNLTFLKLKCFSFWHLPYRWDIVYWATVNQAFTPFYANMMNQDRYPTHPLLITFYWQQEWTWYDSRKMWHTMEYTRPVWNSK
jgi:hypothetical protein